MSLQTFGRHAPAGFHFSGEAIVVRPCDERLGLVFPEVMGAFVQRPIPERFWSAWLVMRHKPIEFLHQLRHREKGRPAVEPMALIDVLSKLAANRIGGFKHGHAMSTRGHAHGRCESAHTGTDDDDFATLTHAGTMVDSTSGKQILNQAV